MKKGTRIILTIFGVLAALVCVLILCIFLLLEPKVGINGFASLDNARLKNVSKTITVIDYSGDAVADTIYDTNKIFTSLDSLPKHLPAAFVAIEDKRFYSHSGVDYIRMLSAAKNNLFARSFKEGASTISQQLIKNTHLKSDKTLSRKIQEIRIARDLERKYTKDEILEIYLNILYFGNNIYGVGTAARIMFDKSATELSLAESALLAGIINNPAAYNPYSRPAAAEKRRNTVLRRMLTQELITESEYTTALSADLGISDAPAPSNRFINSCLGEAAEILGKEQHELFGSGYIIKSYCKRDLQERMDTLITEYKPNNADIYALVLENNGRFLASSDTRRGGSATKRQPGSTIKPIICYAPALEKKLIYPVTPILDKRTTFGNWSPSNYNDRYYGWIGVDDALSLSLNVPAVKLLESVGVDEAKAVARKFGLEFDRRDDSLALALGGMSKGVTLTSLVDAYATLARGGEYVRGRFVESILDKDGALVYRAEDKSRQAISEDNAFLITKMLQKCAREGTARHVGYYGTNVAAKTGTVGTSEGNTDAYTIAYTPRYTVAVWLGASDGLMPNEHSGGNLPAKIARKILEMLGDKTAFDTPENITRADIDINELKDNHKVVLAGDGIKEIDRKSVLFSADNMPRVYSRPQTFIENESILDDFDNFEIIDGILN